MWTSKAWFNRPSFETKSCSIRPTVTRNHKLHGGHKKSPTSLQVGRYSMARRGDFSKKEECNVDWRMLVRTLVLNSRQVAISCSQLLGGVMDLSPRMRGSSTWFRSRFSVAGLKGHPRFLSTCDPETNLMPNPTERSGRANSWYNSPSSGTKTTDMSKRTISG